MDYRKRHYRDRHIFDVALLDDIAEEVGQQDEALSDELAMLHRCIEKLSQLDQELVQGRYASDESVKQLAKLRGKSAGAISQALYRIRDELADCLEQAKKSEENVSLGFHRRDAHE